MAAIRALKVSEWTYEGSRMTIGINWRMQLLFLTHKERIMKYTTQIIKQLNEKKFLLLSGTIRETKDNENGGFQKQNLQTANSDQLGDKLIQGLK